MFSCLCFLDSLLLRITELVPILWPFFSSGWLLNRLTLMFDGYPSCFWSPSETLVDLWYILELSGLNSFIPRLIFCKITLAWVHLVLHVDSWMMSLDLKDAYWQVQEPPLWLSSPIASLLQWMSFGWADWGKDSVVAPGTVQVGDVLIQGDPYDTLAVVFQCLHFFQQISIVMYLAGSTFSADLHVWNFITIYR